MIVSNNVKVDISKLNTVEDFINFAVKQFKDGKIYFGHGTDNAWDEALNLVLASLNLPLEHIESDVLARKLDASEKKIVLKLIERRLSERIPSAYLTHRSLFAGSTFYVDKRVLIPRSPLAELIRERFFPWVDYKKVKRILDIGTGSGCIAISLAHVFPDAQVDAIDISDGALEVARINCNRHEVTDRVRLLKSNLFDQLAGEKYDIIISNPPYVGGLEMKGLPKEYYHEPEGALLAGKRGDEIVARIICGAAKHLTPKGILVVEVGNSAPLVMKKYQDLPFVWLDFALGEGEAFLLTKEGLGGVK